MVNTGASCTPNPTAKEKTWLYDEYYIGDRDAEDRKHGQGENHWTGAKSIECYTGHMVQDTMNGLGDYRWRYSGPECEFVTYEGQFLANQMHGYGVMSYPDGRILYGLYHSNVRWGPGVERHANLRANVGFWRADQLVRLAWQPNAPCIIPDLTAGQSGPAFVEPFRTSLAKNLTIIGDTNLAIELLKQQGADPCVANEKWPKLYPKNCTDLKSLLCHVDIWTHDYYKGKIQWLDEQKSPSGDDEQKEDEKEMDEDESIHSPKLTSTTERYFAWNNSRMMVEMMKHCYKHEKQRGLVKLPLDRVLSGPRKRFRPPAEHERDSRTLLMASYLGHMINVAQLVNESGVYPNIADMQGNTAIMYASCGSQDKIIHFLVEAGGDVNSMNDSCCTALGVALMWYLCTERDIVPKDMVRCLLSKTQTAKTENTSEWLINRDLKMNNTTNNVQLAANKPRFSPDRKNKSSPNLSDKRKSEVKQRPIEGEYDSDESYNEEKRLYTTINQEYEIRLLHLFAQPRASSDAAYVFDVRNMINDVLSFGGELLPAASSKNTVKKKTSKKLNEVIKPSAEAIKGSGIEDVVSLTCYEKQKQELLSKMMLTILQLLSDGADPRMVNCPKPALLMAIASGNSNLIRHLVRYGADVNEAYPECFNYTALEVAVSLPFNAKNLELVRTLLESGADANHRLKMPFSQSPDLLEIALGPTLLHAVITRKTEFEIDEDIQYQLIQLLLQHNCDPTPTFMGFSAIEIAMSKKLDLLKFFVKTPARVDLNAIINDKNQTILVKMFSASYFLNNIGADRIPILTNLLLYGADALIECHDGDKTYGNIFEFAKKTLHQDLGYRKVKQPEEAAEPAPSKSKKGNLPPAPVSSAAPKAKETEAKVKETKLKTPLKPSDHDISEYIATVQHMAHCVSMLYSRWVQAKLMRELLHVIWKYKHRNWNMIIKEHSNKKRVGLWLTSQRCIEMWDIFKETRRKPYLDDQVLKHLLCIVQFYNKRWFGEKSFKRPMTIGEKDAIDAETVALLKEYKTTKLKNMSEKLMKKYVKPELCSEHDTKFDICFDCALPLQYDEGNVLCSLCQLVWFCSESCLKSSVTRSGCHPCSDYLMKKHFSGQGSVSPIVSETLRP